MKADYQMMVKTYQEAGGKPGVFKDSSFAHLVVHKNKVLGSHLVEGLKLDAKETDNGVDIDLTLEEGVRLAQGGQAGDKAQGKDREGLGNIDSRSLCISQCGQGATSHGWGHSAGG